MIEKEQHRLQLQQDALRMKHSVLRKAQEAQTHPMFQPTTTSSYWGHQFSQPQYLFGNSGTQGDWQGMPVRRDSSEWGMPGAGQGMPGRKEPEWGMQGAGQGMPGRKEPEWGMQGAGQGMPGRKEQCDNQAMPQSKRGTLHLPSVIRDQSEDEQCLLNL
jgi:hypothetical protein